VSEPESDLKRMRCQACEGGVEPLTRDDAAVFLKQTPGWTLDEDGKQIRRTYSFKNFYETMAFVNALAWIAHVEDHHPDFEVSYKACAVRYSTHAIKGLSVNDFICAAKINGLIGE
jgi:4a-hydroxytetrahydrobiopterin dehydratase